MAAPERFAKRQIPLAPRAPSIHGPSRHFAATQQTVAFRGIATLTPATLHTDGGRAGSKGGRCVMRGGLID